MAKRNKEIKQINGKLERAQSLNEILGKDGFDGKYNTKDEGVYMEYINDMDLSDLQRHATKVNEFPLNSREKLVNKLVRKFRAHWSSHIDEYQELKKPDLTLEKDIKDIINGKV